MAHHRNEGYTANEEDGINEGYTASEVDDNHEGYTANEEDENHGENRNKKNKRRKRAMKKLKKGDRDDEDDTDFIVETPPDGGTTAWTVCIGSAVLTSCNAVIRASLHESIDSINEDFSNKVPLNNTDISDINGQSQNVEDFTTCYNGLTSNFNNLFGTGYPKATACMELGNPAYWDCMADFVQHGTGLERPYADGMLLISGFCPELYKLFPDVMKPPGGGSPEAFRLTAGNIQAPPLPTSGEDIGGQMYFIYVCLSFLCFIIAAMLSVFVGYRVVSVVGSVLIAIGFLVTSVLEDDQSVLAEILIGGVAGIGSSFVRYAAIVAILEYFRELRMRAIVISGLGAILTNFLIIGLSFVDAVSFEWRKTFKFQAIPAGVSLITSLFMKPLKYKYRSHGSRESNSRSRKCSDSICSSQLWKDIVLYLVTIIFFLDQMGRPIFSEGMQSIMEEKGFSEIQVDIQPLIENGGSLLGLLSLLLWRRHSLSANLTVMAAMDILIGILALHVPEMTAFVWAAVYSAIFGFTEGVFNSVIQDAIPKGFQRRHIKMVAGILGFVAGVGSIVSSFVGDAVDDRGEGNGSSYYFAGACLLVCSAFAIISRLILVRRQERDDDNELQLDSVGHDGQQRY